MTEDEAKRRFMLLNLVRLTALGFVMAGAANVAEKLLPEFAPVLGFVLLVIGVVDFFIAPVLLKKYWRQRGE
jgi:hypothetical protein